MNFFRNIQKKLINYLPDHDVYMEAAKRNMGKQISSLISPTASNQRTQDVATWQRAVSSATDPNNPNRIPLLDVYDKIENDNHLTSIQETRLQRILRSKFRIVNEAGETDDELTDLLERPWFEDFQKYCIRKTFRGTQVIEIFELTEEGEINTVELIPERHIKPHLGIIVEKPDDDKGWNYLDAKMTPYYIQVGKNNELGLNRSIAPTALAKMYAMGAFSTGVDKYGVPYRWIKTDNLSQKRQDELADVLQNMGPAGWGIFSTEETMETLAVDLKPELFEKLITRCNSEMSKAVLGQDGTSDHKDSSGTYGSLKVLEEVANDRHEADKTFIKNIMNLELIPRLVQISSVYSKFANHRFEWDDSEELELTSYIDAVVKLAEQFELDPDEITKRTGITIIGVKALPFGGGDVGKY